MTEIGMCIWDLEHYVESEPRKRRGILHIKKAYDFSEGKEVFDYLKNSSPD